VFCVWASVSIFIVLSVYFAKSKIPSFYNMVNALMWPVVLTIGLLLALLDILSPITNKE
jgi:hypothetical protein